MSKRFPRLRQTSQKLRREIQARVAGYILAAFGFVAGLAWNDAISAFIQYIFPGDKGTIWAKLLYAILVTLIVVLGSLYLTRWTVEEAKKKKK